jgi:hypothetical protein
MQPTAERGNAGLEVKRALLLVDRAARVWSREAVANEFRGTTQFDQLDQIDTPAAAHRAETLLNGCGERASGWARLAVYQARLAAHYAGMIEATCDPSVVADRLREVAERAAGCLAALAAQANDVDKAITTALETAIEMRALR